jgi:hypothetical protein
LLYIYIYIYIYVNSISTSGANNPSILSAWSICIIIISLLTVWGHMGIRRWRVGEWLLCEKASDPHFPDTFSHLPSMVRTASGVCAQWVAGILIPPSPGSPPCVICMSGWSVFQILSSKESRSMPCGRQGILNSACARLSRVGRCLPPPSRNNYLMCRIEKPVKSLPGFPPTPPPPSFAHGMGRNFMEFLLLESIIGCNV